MNNIEKGEENNLNINEIIYKINNLRSYIIYICIILIVILLMISYVIFLK